MSPDTSEHIPP